MQTYYNDGNNSPGSGVNQVVQYVSTGPHRQGLFLLDNVPLEASSVT